MLSIDHYLMQLNQREINRIKHLFQKSPTAQELVFDTHLATENRFLIRYKKQTYYLTYTDDNLFKPTADRQPGWLLTITPTTANPRQLAWQKRLKPNAGPYFEDVPSLIELVTRYFDQYLIIKH